ncbi:MAG: 50S ribosomal protein L11 methyltransferase [Anaerovoracaceae bacterium]
MKYIEVSIGSDELTPDEITGILLMRGVTDSVVEDPGIVSEMMKGRRGYDWDYIDDSATEDLPDRPAVKFYAEDSPEGKARVKDVLSGFAGKDTDVSVKYVDDSEWKDKYREFFRTTELTDRLVVRPSWDDTPVKPGMKIIELDPGMAFGTGGHETTAMCAQLIDEEGCAGKYVLDVGCGSGILSIAAAKLGAERVLGIDIDEEAVTSATENAAKNDPDGVIEIRRGDLTEGVDFTADIIAANLVAELIVSFLPDAVRHMRPGAAFICSGILNEKAEMVKDAAEHAGLSVEKEISRGEWTALLGRKQDS